MSMVEHYQRRLSALLLAGAEPEAIRAQLRDDPVLADLRAYIDGLQDTPLRVAAQLAARWGSRSQ